MAKSKTDSFKLIEQERARAKALFDSIGDGVIATDETAHISEVNNAAVNILGFDRKDFMGAWYPKAVKSYAADGSEIDTTERPIIKALITGSPVTDRIFYGHKSGKIIPVAVTVSPVILDDRPIGAINVFRNISEEYEVDRMKSEFISIASHQLRTPLTAIKTYSHMMASGFTGELSETQTEFMDIIMSSIDRMNELINTLLDISRIEEGRLSIEPRFVDLERLIEEVVTELTPFARARKVSVTIQYETDDINANTDPLLVREVCANLLSNAIKYTPEGGTIAINVAATEKTVKINIEDTGYGIPHKEQKRVFSKFFRAENILDKDTSGTGLGLYLVKQIAESLEGDIAFKSHEGKGSRFTFSLPRHSVKN